jgi:iron complex outermembrane receptor protein
MLIELCLGAGLAAHSEIAAPDADSPPRDEVVVSDTRRDALAPEKARAEKTPGNVGLVLSEEFDRRYAVSLRDALGFAPGVVMQPVFGEDGRLSVRGSGLAQNFHLRGVELLLNGVPLNAADGFGDFQELDLLFASHIDVLRGANAMRAGSATLGGAIDIVGADATNVDEALLIRLEGGSFGSGRTLARAAGKFGDADGLVAFSHQRQDGFRDHAQQRNDRAYVNLGFAPAAGVDLRGGVFLSDIDQEIPGAVTLAAALADPQSAARGNILGDYQRDMRAARAFARAGIDAGAIGTFSLGASYGAKRLYHPIPVVIDQTSDDVTLSLGLEGASANGLGWSLGWRWRDTQLESIVSRNLGNATRGALLTWSDQRSHADEIYGEGRAAIGETLTLIAGARYLRTTRDFDDRINNAEDAVITFDRISPRAGLLWRAAPGITLFANYSGVYEPPTFGDLTQAGVAGFTPIDAQRGRSVEVGARVRSGALEIDAAIYDARLKGEFVAFTAAANTPAPIFNADRTRHRGVEFAASARLDNVFGGVSLAPRIAYAWNDFRFRDDAVFRDNRLAGLPVHIGRAEVAATWRGLRVAPSVIFQSGDNFIDYANTLRAPGHALIGVEASLRAGDRFTLFLDARNLAREAYVASYSTLADARLSPNLAVVTPGEGRAVFLGVKAGIGGAP